MKVFLADSNELIRVGLRSILERETRIQIIGEASSSEELLLLCDQLTPENIIIDYASDGFSIDVVPKFLQKFSDANFIAITPAQ
ncbi:MAG TPA: hypothetical protein PLP27_11550, partial [Crocinitomicaceae bacterium]|nr:hypothetical protein [Crocinitomicaceae bacterium]